MLKKPTTLKGTLILAYEDGFTELCIVEVKAKKGQAGLFHAIGTLVENMADITGKPIPIDYSGDFTAETKLQLAPLFKYSQEFHKNRIVTKDNLSHPQPFKASVNTLNMQEEH